jgi:hypothetical protein
MKARRLKALGFALLGSLALLFAGCTQQAGGGTGGTGNGAVTSVGIQLPQPPPGGYNGLIGVNVTVNEGAQVRRIVLKVDGQQVSQINVAGLRPQSIDYTLLLDTAQLDPATKQPRFRNGTHTLTVEVTDANNNTRSASTTATFRNQDYVRGIEVSQTDNPKAPVTSGNIQWYGNGDVFVTVDIVNYSGATYSLSASGSSFTLQASGGQGGSLPGYQVSVARAAGPGTITATPVSGQPQLKLAKSSNGSAEFNNVEAKVQQSSTIIASKTFGLDNVAPTGTPRVQYRRIVLEYNFADLSGTVPGTSQTLFRGAGALDGGVRGITYQVAFRLSGSVVATATLPHPNSPGVTVSGLINFASHPVRITAVEDALGNKQTLDIPAGTFRLVDNPITLSDVTVDNTTPDAGGTFRVSFNRAGGTGSNYCPYVALKLGNRLVRFVDGLNCTIRNISGITALFGAQYVLYVVDDAGNFAVADLPVTVSQPASDKTPPAITVSLPSSVGASGSINLSGTYSDPYPPSTPPPYSVQIYTSHGSLGGFEWYLAGPTSSTVSSGSYGPSSVAAPNYTGPLGVVVYGLDRFSNLGFATGTVNVE